MKKLRFLLLAGAFLGTAFHSHAADPLENLIEEHKDVPEPEDKEDLPPVFLNGNGTGVEIYSPAAEAGRGNTLCQAVGLEEWVEISHGNSEDNETKLNLSIPRLRTALEEACLVRSGDLFLAIGKGWQKFYPARDFIVKREGVRCANDSPFALWADFAESFDQDPLFFSSDLDLKEGDNHYRDASSLPTVPRKTFSKKQWKEIDSFAEEFDVTIHVVDEENQRRLISLRRKSVSNDDADLTNEALFWNEKDTFQKIWEERVHLSKDSGHVRLDAVLDFNNDGFPDLMISGDAEGCPFHELLQGGADGFTTAGLPNKPCGC